jgi:hypothetical protein
MHTHTHTYTHTHTHTHKHTHIYTHTHIVCGGWDRGRVLLGLAAAGMTIPVYHYFSTSTRPS